MVGRKQVQGKPHENIPTVQLSFNDISVIESAVMGYLSYLRGGVPPSRIRDTRIQLLQGVRSRLAKMLLHDTAETAIPLTCSEIQALHEALAGFARLVRQIVPPSQERDETLQVFERLRRDLALRLSPPS